MKMRLGVKTELKKIDQASWILLEDDSERRGQSPGNFVCISGGGLGGG